MAVPTGYQIETFWQIFWTEFVNKNNYQFLKVGHVYKWFTYVIHFVNVVQEAIKSVDNCFSCTTPATQTIVYMRKNQRFQKQICFVVLSISDVIFLILMRLKYVFFLVLLACFSHVIPSSKIMPRYSTLSLYYYPEKSQAPYFTLFQLNWVTKKDNFSFTSFDRKFVL